tara:strand:+ start:5583 stop:6152 length:570 start_codon:yes stop_codon:yes gene_type:complete
MNKTILQYTNMDDREILKRVSESAENENSTKNLISDLKDTLSNIKNGAGLAAPQIGVNTRVFITRNYRDDKPEEFLTFINPEIKLKSKEKIMIPDGCLSIPNVHSKTIRHSYVKVSYLDESFNKVEEELEGFQSVVFQHELDHLNGILFLDLLESEEQKQLENFFIRQENEPNIFYIEGKIIEMTLKNG